MSGARSRLLAGRARAATLTRALSARAGEGLARAGAGLASRAADPVARVAPVDDPPSTSPPGYATLWRPPTEAAARELIVTYEDEERFEATGRQEAERILPHVTTESTVVDLGCGIGRIALYVAPHCKALWAVDVSEEMLSMARARLDGIGRVRFALCADTHVADIPSGSVDLVYSIIVLQHLEREDAFLLVEDVVRMLRRGGKAFFTWPNLTDAGYLASFLDYAHKGESANRSRARMYTPSELSVLLPAAGFSHVEVHDAPDIVTICTR